MTRVDDSRALGPARPVLGWVTRVLSLAPIVAFTAMFQVSTPQAVGLWGLLAMLALLAMRVPVALAMALPGAVGVVSLSGWSAMEGMFKQLAFNSFASWSLSVLPMFILMGNLLSRSGATEKLFEFARSWTSWLPGGLAISTNAAGAIFASISGSTMAISYALGRVAIPEMLKRGFDKRVTVGSILMAGTGGQVIPPSILMVVYAGVASTPVGPQLIAGLVPGVLLAIGFGSFLWVLAILRPGLFGREQKSTFSWRERWTSLRGVLPVPLLILAVVGGLYSGVFTATEAAAVGVVLAVATSYVYAGRQQFAEVVSMALRDTLAAAGAILFLILGAMMLNRMLGLSKLPFEFAEWARDLDIGRVSFLLVLVGIYLVLGMFMDGLTSLLLTVPILIPTLVTYDIGLIWFGVFIVILGEIALVSPPLGMLSFVVHRLSQDPHVNRGVRITLGDVFISSLWFIWIAVLLVVLIIAFPDIVEWLPRNMVG